MRAALPALTSWRRRRKAENATDAWRYGITWQPVPQAPAPGGTWLIANPAPDGLAEALTAAGLIVRTWDPADARAEASAEHTTVAGIIVAPGTPADLLDALRVHEAPLWCLTRGAVTTGHDDPLPNPDQALLWGSAG